MYTGYRGPDTPITVNESQGSTLENLRQDTNYLSSNIYGEYTPKLGDDHTLKLLAGWNLETKKYRGTTIKREGLTVPSKPSFGLMDGLTSDPVVSGYDWSYVGAFFRANYGYQGKYLAEFSCRYDGSSKSPRKLEMGLLPLGFDRLAPVGREIHGVVAQLARQFQDTSLGRFDGQWQHRPLQIHRLHDHQNLDGRHRRRTGLLYDGSRSHSAR